MGDAATDVRTYGAFGCATFVGVRQRRLAKAPRVRWRDEGGGAHQRETAIPIAAIFAPLRGDIAARASAASAVRRAHTPVMPSTPPVDRTPYSATALQTGVRVRAVRHDRPVSARYRSWLCELRVT